MPARSDLKKLTTAEPVAPTLPAVPEPPAPRDWHSSRTTMENLRNTAANRLPDLIKASSSEYGLMLHSMVADMPTETSPGRAFNAVYGCLAGKITEPKLLSKILDLHFLGMNILSEEEQKRQLLNPNSPLTHYLVGAAIERCAGHTGENFMVNVGKFGRLAMLPALEGERMAVAQGEWITRKVEQESNKPEKKVVVILAPYMAKPRDPALEQMYEVVKELKQKDTALVVYSFNTALGTDYSHLRDHQISNFVRSLIGFEKVLVLGDLMMKGPGSLIQSICTPQSNQASFKNWTIKGLCLANSEIGHRYDRTDVEPWDLLPQFKSPKNIAKYVRTKLETAEAVKVPVNRAG